MANQSSNKRPIARSGNDVSDAAEAMPEVNRRRMLFGLAAASTAAATGLATGAVAAPAENPKLIALAKELPAVAAAFHVVNDKYLAEYKAWNAETPWAPDELTELGTAWPHDGPRQPGDPEMLALGGFLWRVGDDFPRRIVVTSWGVAGQISRARCQKRQAKKAGRLGDYMAAEAEVKRLKELYKTAKSYEADFAEVRALAGAWHKTSFPVREARREDLERHVGAIMDEPDHTMEGLFIKAQALVEWNRVGKHWGDRLALTYGKEWHGQIAEAILRHAKGGVA